MRVRGLLYHYGFVFILFFMVSCSSNISEKGSKKTNTQQQLSLDTKSTADIRLLSNQEYVWSVSDLVGKTYELSLVKDWTTSTQLSGFDSILWSNLDSKSVNDRMTTSEIIASDAVNSNEVMICKIENDNDYIYDQCPKKIVSRFAEKAFRRPLETSEATQLKNVFTSTQTLYKNEGFNLETQFKESLKSVFSSVLMSPPFFLKSVSLLLKKDLSELNAYEIAEKLSFMVYGSIPDDELLLSAKNKTIFEPSVRKAHFIRLIEKYKDRFIHLFLGQFFEFRRMKDSTELNALFYKESLLVLKDLFLSDAPVTQYLSPGFTYLNKKLADHYKVDGDFNEEFKKINILERGSVLTQGSFLSLTGVVMNENPPLGQPIKRGLWVQSRLLCNPVGVASAELRTEIERVKGTLNPTDPLYKKLELHRNSGASCLNCHQYIDPVGISLEKYDHLGKKRDYYDEYKGTNTIPVVTKGELIGKNFEGVSELSKLLSDLSEFRRCMAERTSVYALGINTTSKDSAFIKTLSQNTTNGKAPSFKELLLKIIESKNFILTRSEKELSK